MARVRVEGDRLVVELEGMHRLWALKRRVTVALAHVRGATVDPGIVHESKGRRGPGLGIPGGAAVGTFRRGGGKDFWDVGRGTRAVVVQLADDEWDRLVVEVDDPRAVVDLVNRSIPVAGR
jgi:hypothetical protein